MPKKEINPNNSDNKKIRGKHYIDRHVDKRNTHQDIHLN